MTSPSTDDRNGSGAGTLAAVVGEIRGNFRLLAAAVLAFLGGSLTTLYVVRTIVWDLFRQDLFSLIRTDTRSQIYFVATPFEVIVFQLLLTLFVGLLFAVETALYGARDALPWQLRGGPRSRLGRSLLALLGVALFPVGAFLGYQLFLPVFPVVFEALAAGGSTYWFVGWAGVAAGVAVAAGLVAQLTFLAGVLSLFGEGGAGDGPLDADR